MKRGTNLENSLVVEKLIHEVDFEKLKEQVAAIYAAQTALTAIGGNENMDIVEKLDGIVNYIDVMRDNAVDVYGYEEKKVFNLTDES